MAAIKITDPLKFYAEVVAKGAEQVDIQDINEQYLSEFLDALQSAINRMSADNIRISHVTSKSRELSAYMANELDADWKANRGFEVLSVGIASLSYDDESKELINMRNKHTLFDGYHASVVNGDTAGLLASVLEGKQGGIGLACGVVGFRRIGGYGKYAALFPEFSFFHQAISFPVISL